MVRRGGVERTAASARRGAGHDHWTAATAEMSVRTVAACVVVVVASSTSENRNENQN